MSYISMNTSFYDPEKNPVEIVERKGLGHPDTLADGIAHQISSNFSKYTLEKFGVVLHHNVDKIYIGGGMISHENKEIIPINVVVNGRMSTSYSGIEIDIEQIQEEAIKYYLGKILPNLDLNKHLNICFNSNTFTDVSPYWYKPRNIKDIPEHDNLMANDTAICVAHNPRTLCEKIAFELERYFWITSDNYITPKFKNIGQDIKVMAIRKENFIDITMCIPIINKYIVGWRDYCCQLDTLYEELNGFLSTIIKEDFIDYKLSINPARNEKYRKYILEIGSCVECGEEGLVGRGNNNNGVISVFRPNTMESPFGKNPVYHTGRVLSYINNDISKRIYDTLGCKNSVISMTKNQTSLIPPYSLDILTETAISKKIVESIVSDVMSLDYTNKIINSNIY